MVAIQRLFFLALLLFLPFSALALPTSAPVALEHSTSRLVADKDAITPGETLLLALEITLKDKWHTYWENPGDTGIPTRLAWELPEGFSAGKAQWPAPHRIDIAGLMNFAYEGTLRILVPVSVPAQLTASEYKFALKADWLVCMDICVPEKGEYTLTLPVGAPSADSYLQDALAALPAAFKGDATYHVMNETLTLSLPAGSLHSHHGETAEFFPLTEGMIENIAAQEVYWGDNALTLKIKRGLNHETPPLEGIVTIGEGNERTSFTLTAQPVQASPQPDTSVQEETAPSGISLPFALLLAFAGGLILNLMPCVLPILSLKALALVKKSAAGRRDAALHGAAYTGGVLMSFAIIAVALIALQQAGSAVGWGFQLQSPGFVTVLALITFVVGLNLSGVFNMPHLFGGAGQSLAAKGGLPGTFFTGALAVLVATPCTAPFMAPALGFALTQPPIAAFFVFQALALGFAMPLLVVSLSPALLALLPRPGAWMHSFKQLMAFPMYATSAWLVWVLTRQGGDQALAETLALLVGAAFVLWLHEHLKSRMLNQLYQISLLVFTVFFGWLLLSGPGTLPEVAEEPFSTARISELRAMDAPVFVYATASWCITCKINENTSLRTSMVMEHFRDSGIVVMKADWTNQDKSISDYLRSFDRQGVPLYVFYPKGGKEPRILPQLLTPYLVIDQTQP